jgi:hypothetical protein
MPNERPDQLSIDDSGLRVPLAVSAMTRLLALLVALIPTAMLTLALKKRRQAAALQSDQPLVGQADDHQAALTVASRPQSRHAF